MNIHTLRPSPARRGFAAVTQGMLGIILLWIALAHPPEALGWRVFLLVLGGGAMAMAVLGWRASSEGVVLRDDGLFTEGGEPVAPLALVEKVDRGPFAFKPSNGFSVRLSEPLPRAWSPGMWWRLGRRVGVGGVTGGAETKVVADALSFAVMQRDGTDI